MRFDQRETQHDLADTKVARILDFPLVNPDVVKKRAIAAAEIANVKAGASPEQFAMPARNGCMIDSNGAFRRPTDDNGRIQREC
jgi:hypothetical protein